MAVATQIDRRHRISPLTLNCERCGATHEKMLDEPETPCISVLAVVAYEAKRLPWQLNFRVLAWAWGLLIRFNIGDPFLFKGEIKDWKKWKEALRANPHRRYRAEIRGLHERLAKALRSQTQTEQWKARALRAEAHLAALTCWTDAGCPDPEEWVRQNLLR